MRSSSRGSRLKWRDLHSFGHEGEKTFEFIFNIFLVSGFFFLNDLSHLQPLIVPECFNLIVEMSGGGAISFVDCGDGLGTLFI